MISAIDKTQLIKTYNERIASLNEQEVPDNLKVWLIASFPHIIEDAFPKKEGFLKKISEARKNAIASQQKDEGP